MKDMLQRFRSAALFGGAPSAGPVADPVKAMSFAPEWSDDVRPDFPDNANVLQLHGFAEGRTVFQGADLPQDASDTPVDTLAVPDHLPDPEVAILSAALLRRFGVEHLPADTPFARKHALILQRLCVVRDPCAVVIGGQGRSVRLTMANGRVMAASFALPGRKKRLVSFEKKLAGKSAAREFSALLAEFCARPVDLLMTEVAVDGVFATAAGMMVCELVTEARLGPAEVPMPLGTATAQNVTG